MDKYCRTRRGHNGDMAQAYCMLDTLGYQHTLRICNIFVRCNNGYTNAPRYYVTHILPAFNIHGSVHRKNIPIYISNKMQCYTVYYIWKLLYMFRVVPPPIISSAYNCIYSIWYLSHRYCYLPLSVGTGLSVLRVAYATHSTLKSVPTDSGR